MAKKNDKLPDLVVKGFYSGKGGTAVTLTRSSVTRLLQALNLGEWEISEQGEQRNVFHPIHLSRATALEISISTPKGKTGVLVLGDASINKAHQQGVKNLALFDMILGAAQEGKQFVLTVTSADQVKIKRSQSAQAINLDPSAC